MANILPDAERIEQINEELSALEQERRQYYSSLRGTPIADLLAMCDEVLGVHGLRGSGPRTKPRQSDLIAALVEHRYPVKALKRQLKRLHDRQPKGEVSC